MSKQVILPRIMEIGAGAISKLPSVLMDIGCKSPLIITDHVMVELGYVSQLESILAMHGIYADIFSDTEPEPTIDVIMSGAQQVLEGEYDCVIALGGGGPIDCAKAIAIIGKHGGKIQDYSYPRIICESGLPIIAIPTTAGSGSEATQLAILTDTNGNEKMHCIGSGFQPVATLVDFDLSLTLPNPIFAYTAINALAHTIEAYVSRKASIFSNSQALAAMRLIGPNLRKAYTNRHDPNAREGLMLGSTLAGIAFSNSSLALVHAMSLPLTTLFHVPHGFSNAILLPIITSFSLPSAPDRYADCARAIGVAHDLDSVEIANAKLIDELQALNEDLKLPTPDQFGIDREEFFNNLPKMTKQVLSSVLPEQNPRIPSAQEIEEIYRKLWD